MNTLDKGRYQQDLVTLYIPPHRSTTGAAGGLGLMNTLDKGRYLPARSSDFVYTVTLLYHSAAAGLGLMNTLDKGRYQHGLVTLYILSHRYTTVLRMDWVS